MQKIATAIRRHPALGLAGAVGLAVLVGAGLRLTTANSTATAPPVPTTQSTDQSPETVTAPFPAPLVSASGRLQNATPSSLLRSTRKDTRAETLVAGRADPFAPIIQATTPLLAPTAGAVQQTEGNGSNPTPNGGSRPTPTAVVPLPISGTLPPLPSLPSLPIATTPVAVLPTPSASAVELPSTPPPLQGLELTGVAQVGDRVALIVREPGVANSRYTFAGDYLANGRVLIKRIDMSAQEPLIILEYNGREHPYSVGGTVLASLP